MTDKCPKCGADRAMSPAAISAWRCGSIGEYKEAPFLQSNDCLRRQLSQARELMQEAAGFIKRTSPMLIEAVGTWMSVEDHACVLQQANRIIDRAEGENDG